MKNINTSSELTAFLDKFRVLREADSSEAYEAYKDLLRSDLSLPDFYSFEEPTPVYKAHITATPNGETSFNVDVTDSQGEVFGESPYTSLTAAYNAVEKAKGDCVFTGDFEITGNHKNGDFLTENGILLLTVTDDQSLILAKSRYLNWLFTTELYLAQPNDFYTAFHWVCGHPAFWSRHNANRHDWSHNYSNFWFDITRNKGKLVYMLEAGAAVEPERIMHYHDLRLDVYAPSFEEGYIKLASLVHKFFNLDGSDRKNVDYEPSELEKTLTSRLAAVENEAKPEL